MSGFLSAGIVGGGDIPDSGISRWLWEQDLTDEWGSNNGTAVSDAGYDTDSKEGNYSKKFDGTDGQYVQVNTRTLTTFSIATWIKAKSSNNGDGNEDGYWPWIGDGQDLQNWLSVRETDDTVQVEWSDGTRTSISYSGGFSTDTWYHIIYAYDSSTLEIYVDGSSIGTASISNKTFEYDRFSDALAATDYDFNGLIDQTDEYDKRLTDTEASNLHSTGSIDG